MCTTPNNDSAFTSAEDAIKEMQAEVKRLAELLFSSSLFPQKRDGKPFDYPCVVNVKLTKSNPLTTETTCVKSELKHILTKKIVFHNKQLAGATKEKYHPYVEISVEHNTLSSWFSSGLKCLLKGILVVVLVGLALWGGCSLVKSLISEENSLSVEYSQSQFEGTNLTQIITLDSHHTWKEVKCPKDN